VKAGARAGPSAGLAATSGNYVVHAGTTDANAVVTRPNPHAFFRQVFWRLPLFLL